MELRDRLLEVIKDRYDTQKKFADDIGVRRQSVHSVLKNGSPGLEFLSKLHDRIPELNLHWLLFGEGKKYVNVAYELPKVGDPVVEYGRSGGVMLEELKANVERMQVQIERMQAEIAGKSRQKPPQQPK